jgi:HAD superfamily hydrolase (TIGR01509 family)
MSRTLPQISAVAFDLDGLMFNTETVYRELTREVLAIRGRNCPDELLDAMMGRPAEEAFQVMIDWHGLEESMEALSAEAERLFIPMLDGHLSPMPGLWDLLDYLESREIPKVVATSSRRRLAIQVLERFDMPRRFEKILTIDDVTEGKPAPEIYLLAAETLRTPPQNLMVLEDSVVGCQAGAAAGAHVVAVPGAFNRHHDFSIAATVAHSLDADVVFQLLSSS